MMSHLGDFAAGLPLKPVTARDAAEQTGGGPAVTQADVTQTSEAALQAAEIALLELRNRAEHAEAERFRLFAERGPSKDQPETRNAHDILLALQLTAEEQLAAQKHILAALAATGSVPSVELSIDSKGLVKPVVKVYDLDPERASQEAQRIFDELALKYSPKGAPA
jgi:hypothetical protein